MTIPELISLVLDSLRRDFYTARDREYKRDERALLKAIATYGYECDQRGWQFSARDILHDLMGLLQEIKVAGADIKYLPVYLRGAVKRHLGQRAEELSARAKTIAPKVSKLVAGVQPVVVVEKSDVETLALVYRELRARRRRPAARAGKQGEMRLI